jgi:prevent-host-death family protein
MKNTITANELKTKGVSAIEEVTASNNEAIITVRGKNKYVVLSIEEYNQLREYELEAAKKNH